MEGKGRDRRKGKGRKRKGGGKEGRNVKKKCLGDGTLGAGQMISSQAE